jgi:hypothetical protein
MEWVRYELVRSENGLKYTFYSEGPRGRIRKEIRFQLVPGLGKSTFNLAFGNYIEGADHLDDRSINNNNDRLKILHTVAFALIDFLEFRLRAIVWIKGSTLPRTRLYQMMISSVLMEINGEYEIYGKHGKEMSPFRKGVNYEEFIVFKKIM